MQHGIFLLFLDLVQHDPVPLLDGYIKRLMLTDGPLILLYHPSLDRSEIGLVNPLSTLVNTLKYNDLAALTGRYLTRVSSPEEASFGPIISSQEPAWRRIAPTSTT